MKDNRIDFLEERQSEGNVLYQKKTSWRQNLDIKNSKTGQA
jgi:cell shape-determining protein MreC